MCKPKQTTGTLAAAFTLLKLTMLVGSVASVGSAMAGLGAYVLPVVIPAAVLSTIGLAVVVVKTPTITYGRLATAKATAPQSAPPTLVIEQVHRPAIAPAAYVPDPLLEVVDAELVEEPAL